ncbi:molybdopterin dinucleotide binding domain-containing protein [Mangrovicoccus ximenensis]|uniref:molybdopterin dinucleotide binding domain-containing protein n=1 Tax=Mangrovicoccus ximenensis TaxID=1911570 RepID=UPI0011AE93FB|nr:molybdopterin dinucleotide binding domain-containing protein [Mangrovicoccus ximenensis]
MSGTDRRVLCAAGADWPGLGGVDPGKGAVIEDGEAAEMPFALLDTFDGQVALAGGLLVWTDAGLALLGGTEMPEQPPAAPGFLAEVWRAPREWLGSALSAALPLHLISHQPEGRLHSQLDHGAASLAGKRLGREPCRLNPEDAAERGISEGDMVRVFNHRGACLSVARLGRDIRPGVISLPTGAWHDPDLEGDPTLCRHGNPNVLTSEIAQGSAAMTCLVEAERFGGPAPEVRAHRPPEIEPRQEAPYGDE